MKIETLVAFLNDRASNVGKAQPGGSTPNVMGVGDTHHWTSQWILLRACVVAGDETILAKQLGVPVSSVVNWVLGDARVPTDYLPHAVDIVVGEKAKKLRAHKDQVHANRELLERIRRQYRTEDPGPT